jgi:predicted nucleotidyltransferase component of viral defense system
VGGVLMFSKEYLTKLTAQTGFRADSLQKQMTLLDLLREITRHPLLKRQFVLKGGTAINLFWFQLPRLSVDIDLNYIGSEDRETMVEERPMLEKEMEELIESRGISVNRVPSEHAGGKWRLRAPSAFGGTFTIEVDLNFIMRVPVWGVESKSPFPLDEDYHFDCTTVLFEELFGGKIKALMDRSAARDLYDVFKLSQVRDSFDMSKLRKNLILFGITDDDDWRKKDFRTVDDIDQRMVDEHLQPLLRSTDSIDLELMKTTVRALLAELTQYDKSEQGFMNRFLDDGVYEPSLLFPDEKQAKRLERHPAVLWKLQNHRLHLGLDKKL